MNYIPVSEVLMHLLREFMLYHVILHFIIVHHVLSLLPLHYYLVFSNEKISKIVLDNTDSL